MASKVRVCTDGANVKLEKHAEYSSGRLNDATPELKMFLARHVRLVISDDPETLA